RRAEDYHSGSGALIIGTGGRRVNVTAEEVLMKEWKKAIRKRLVGLMLAPQRETEIVEELSAHLQDRYNELLSAGETVDQARRTALAELSDGQLLARELARTERPFPTEPVVFGASRGTMFTSVWRDLRFGARLLLKTRGF